LKHVAFATSSKWPQLTPDDRLAAIALEQRGVRVSPAVWSDPTITWSDHDAIVIRSTWDYHLRVAEFMAWIDTLERMGCTVWNPCRLLRWNANKRYLMDLAMRGVPIVPTESLPGGDEQSLRALMDARQWDDVVVKPTVSATAHGARRVRRADLGAFASSGVADYGELLVQPFIREIENVGEWSLIFFSGGFSHSVRKRPVAGDYRVQSEYGGSAVAEPASARVVAAGEAVLAAVSEPWLYARVDGVETREGFLLMELEMLEPLLFFELDAAAPARFADALIAALDRESRA
jgi:glutathione synthase/RimK-type ligase-like ATP-grasp enzyme